MTCIVECCADEDKAGASDVACTPRGVRRSSACARKSPSRCDSDCDSMRPSPRASSSQPPPSAAKPPSHRSSRGQRSSVGLADEERAERVRGPVPVSGTPEASNTAVYPLTRKSSEGLRYIPKLLESDERGSARALPREEESATQPAVEVEQALPSRPSLADESKDDRNNLQPKTTEPEALEEPVSVHGRSSLPSAPPSLIGRQCLVVACFSTCLLFLLFTLSVVLAYSRWVATPALTTPTSNGDAEDRQQKLDDSAGCDSLFSFSHCADADMFG